MTSRLDLWLASQKLVETSYFVIERIWVLKHHNRGWNTAICKSQLSLWSKPELQVVFDLSVRRPVSGVKLKNSHNSVQLSFNNILSHAYLIELLHVGMGSTSTSTFSDNIQICWGVKIKRRQIPKFCRTWRFSVVCRRQIVDNSLRFYITKYVDYVTITSTGPRIIYVHHRWSFSTYLLNSHTQVPQPL